MYVLCKLTEQIISSDNMYGHMMNTFMYMYLHSLPHKLYTYKQEVLYVHYYSPCIITHRFLTQTNRDTSLADWRHERTNPNQPEDSIVPYQ